MGVIIVSGPHGTIRRARDEDDEVRLEGHPADLRPAKNNRSEALMGLKTFGAGVSERHGVGSSTLICDNKLERAAGCHHRGQSDERADPHDGAFLLRLICFSG